MSMDDLAAAEQYMAEVPAVADQSRTPLLRFPYYVLCGEIAEPNKLTTHG